MSIQTLRPAFATFRPRRSAAEAALSASASCHVDVVVVVDVVRTVEGAAAIACEWRALEAATPEATAFQSYDWCSGWMRAQACADDRWRIVVVRDGGRIVALWPLQLGRFAGARVLSWLGEPWTQYGDALLAEGSDRLRHLAAAWQEIAAWEDVDLVKLGRVRADAALHLLPGLSGDTPFHSEEAPFIDLRRTAPTPPDKRLRARQRRLAQAGPLEFEIVTDAERRRAFAQDALTLKRGWLDARSLASSGLYHRTVDDLLQAMADSESFVVGRLSVGGETAALELGLIAAGRYRSLLGCYDSRFSHGSPGHLLIARMVDWCRDAGLAAYDLMVPADPYKWTWAAQAVPVCDHLVVRRWRGEVAAAWFRMRPKVKQAYARMPGRLRRIAVPPSRDG